MDGFPLQHLLRFVDFDTSLCCRSAFHGLMIHCKKWNKLDALLRRNDIHKIFKFACQNGSVKLANYCLLGGRIDQSEMNCELSWACVGGRRELVELLISKGATYWDSGLRGACEGGCKELVELMILHGATDWDGGLRRACANGDKGLAELMILKGATDWNWGLRYACVGGCKELVELMILKGATNWNWGLYAACEKGHKELVELMISYGANNCGNCRKSMQSHLN
jgi:hypothetical protein